MVSNRLVFVALAFACIVAAAGGGYVATRQNAVPTPASAQGQTAAPASTSASAASAVTTLASTRAAAKPVQETEVNAATSKTAASSSKPAATKRADAPARAAAARDSNQPWAMARQDATPAPTNAVPQLPAAAAAPIVDSTPAAPRPDEHAAQEPARVPDPPQRAFEELVVSADSVIGLQTESRVSSETARVEDRLEARVTRDVKVGGRVAIPAGARALGSVMQVDRGGKFKEKARLGVRFHTLVLADGRRIPISTETIFRDGEAPGNSSASKMGGATVGGAILGAILGGGKGAAIGAAAGAGAGAAAVAASDRNAATLPAGSLMTVRILQPITVTTDNK